MKSESDSKTSSCNHKGQNLKSFKGTKTVAGLSFKYSTQKCSDCDSVLWSKENESSFHRWLSSQKKENRDRFILQKVEISNDIVELAKELALNHYKTESNVYQAALSVYFTFLPTVEGYRELVDSCTVSNTNTEQKKIQVNPGLFLTIESNAKLFGLTNSSVAAWAINHVLTAVKIGQDNTSTLIATILNAA